MQPADSLPNGVACEFEWDDMINDNHPCADKYLNGFAKEEPCILVKLNKVLSNFTFIHSTEHFELIVSRFMDGNLVQVEIFLMHRNVEVVLSIELTANQMFASFVEER